ncbi:gluconate 2-dehydrogenase subunit 3 family protein [Dyadobacter sp. CY312]|uniref:gluconate 2-dehydrogenase subunit 3 family protein n=1 Tax=Dyadobacter sp. CY312 TaxID=2907303 RepID=UPI00286D8034|nr:gluconate 2-dehydrogenase subunit 3 family protein [Dyadobacter sp. CY312]
MMNRREVLKSVAVMLGGAFSAPTLMAMDNWERKVTANAENLQLTEIQKNIVAEVAEMIIPRTNTPGAKDAGVPAFVVMMLQDCYRKPEHLSFVAGVQDLEKRGFLSLNQQEKTKLLKAVEADTVQQMIAYNVQQTKMGDNEDREQMKEVPKGLPYWRLMKELTLLGYFTSEAGIKASFDYVPIPGKLEITKLKPGQKAFAY